MSAETILSYITRCGGVRRLEFQISMQCAPVLKGIKVSNIVTVAKQSWKMLRPILKKCGIICIPLFTGEQTEVLLLYRYKALKAHLDREEVRGFLQEQGYRQYDAVSVILELRKRYMAYSVGKQEFPHELGVILEYPVEDVRGFMEHKGEDFLASGYWKVYHNLAGAKKIFADYDRAREQAMLQIVNGCSLTEVAGEEMILNLWKDQPAR